MHFISVALSCIYHKEKKIISCFVQDISDYYFLFFVFLSFYEKKFANFTLKEDTLYSSFITHTYKKNVSK